VRLTSHVALDAKYELSAARYQRRPGSHELLARLFRRARDRYLRGANPPNVDCKVHFDEGHPG